MKVVLYKMIPAWGLPEISPFCFKIETFLRMSGIPYTSDFGDNRKAPKGKLPYIKCDNQVVSDSNHIINYLEQKTGKSLNRNLNKIQNAESIAFRSLIEDRLYFIDHYRRWISVPGKEVYKPVMFELAGKYKVPKMARPLFFTALLKIHEKQSYAQGMGRHSEAEIADFGIEILRSISDYLSNKPYFMGDEVTNIDATIFSFFCQLYFPPIDDEIREYTKTLDNIFEYCERIRKEYWSDYDFPSFNR